MDAPTGFKITGGAEDPYEVSWTTSAAGYKSSQKYTENVEFNPAKS
ncbi:MAG: hypothetical protein ACOX1T_02825 [Saccharofermentanales bacterium]